MTTAFDPELVSASADPSDVPLHLVASDSWDDWLSRQPGARAWTRSTGFEPDKGAPLLVPGTDGQIAAVALPLLPADTPFKPAVLAEGLPAGSYRLESTTGNAPDAERLAFAWWCGAYRFRRYKSGPPKAQARLVLPDKETAIARARREAEATYLARDLVNTPASDMGPEELAEAVRDVAERFEAKVSTIIGDDLLTQNFPMIHAVGRASSRAPRLIDLTWGPEEGRKLTIIGKGVCFDSGGLNIKPGNSMELMKKDMGGAANALALAQMVMAAEVPVRLRLLIPAVENSISGNAFRPGDVLDSRKGLTVEIGNTDAEGRLILADALALADEEAPELMVDLATLTGAARVALGPELPPFYTDDENLAGSLQAAAAHDGDPIWRMPLHQPYAAWLDSQIADINHISAGGFAGSVTAALFLKRFVENAKSWAHFDIYAWTPKALPGKPVGGEAQAIRALMSVIEMRFTS